MTSRKTDYQTRKETVLGIVVNEYIKTVTPVSSGLIADDHLPGLSSATIRHILAELEEEGYLTHPHTSAGRVPTQEGYRFYVDHLMHEIHLLEKEQDCIRVAYEQDIRNLETVLENTSQVISDLTQYTSIITIDGQKDRIYCRGINYVLGYGDDHDLRKIQDILKALEEKERILQILNRQIEEKTKIYIGHEITCSSMEDCALAVSRYRGRGQGPSGCIAVLGPQRMDYQKVISALDYVSRLMNEAL